MTVELTVTSAVVILLGLATLFSIYGALPAAEMIFGGAFEGLGIPG